MKTELKTAGTVVLDRTEITEALRKHLKSEHHFDLTRAVYSIKGNTIDTVTIDVVKSENGVASERSLAVVGPAAQTQHLVGKRLKKHQRVNMGIFDKLRLYFESEKKKGTKEMQFAEVYPLVKAWYPTISEKKLQIYLYDSRQFSKPRFDGRLEFSKVSGIIKLF